MKASTVIQLTGWAFIVLCILAAALNIIWLVIPLVAFYLIFTFVMIVSDRARNGFADWLERHE
jgi:hypothetical protein